MKIVLFDFTRQFGGAPQLAADVTKRLAADNEVEVIDAYNVCQDYITSLAKANIKTHILLPEAKEFYIGYRNNKLQRLWRGLCQLPSFWLLQRRLIKKIRAINPDVIWVTGIASLFFSGSSSRLRRYPLVRYVTNCLPAVAIRGWERWLMKHLATLLMAISTETARQLQLAGIKDDKIRIVFDTIEMADTLKRSTEPLETPLPGADGHPRILLAARFLRGKGQHTAIKAVARLKAEGLEPTLWLAGDTYGNDLSYEEYLHDLVSQLELYQNVHFLGWRSDVPAIMRQSEIVVVPSYTEGFCHVVLEAMLLRRPVVATPVGGIKDSIENGKNGLTFPVDDDETLAGHIKRLAVDKKYVATLTENGYKTATEKFNPEIHTKRVTQAFIEAVNRKRKDK
jgi:glycosyltransferase involved in cell wall biosynthesis